MTNSQGDIIDGLCYSVNAFKPLCYYFQYLMLSQLGKIRRANNYRPLYVVCPEAGAQIIPARDQIEQQSYMEPGSVLYALRSSIDLTGLYSVQITESESGMPLFSESALVDGYGGAFSGLGFFSKPIVIPEPGLVNIIISSQKVTDTVAGTVQIMLVGMEPLEPSVCSLS